MSRILKLIGITVFGGLILYIGWTKYSLTTIPETTHSSDLPEATHNRSDSLEITYNGSSFKVKDCEEPKDENARFVCPMLYCDKEIMDSGRLKGEFWSESVEDRYKDGVPFILTGKIKYGEEPQQNAFTRYRCVINEGKVVKFDLLTESEWKHAKDSGDLWKY